MVDEELRKQKSKEKEWWQLLDWNMMKNTWKILPKEIKNKIREAGLAPNFDVLLEEEEEA